MAQWDWSAICQKTKTNKSNDHLVPEKQTESSQIFTNHHSDLDRRRVVIAAVCKVIQLQYDLHQKFSKGSVVSFHLKLDVSEWRIFSGCSDDAVCSPLHGVYSILCSSCIPVHSVEWSKETDCQCIQPCTFKAQQCLTDGKSFISRKMIRREVLQTISWNSLILEIYHKLWYIRVNITN